MSKYTQEIYHCDNCRVRLPTVANQMNIVTKNSDSNIGWSRLIVTVERYRDSHNNGAREAADLCQSCAHKLLLDAANRVQSGERLSKGVESSEMRCWEKVI